MQTRAEPLALNRERCKRCGVCVELCPRQVFSTTLEGYPDITEVEECSQCTLCELWCPDYAIEVRVDRNAKQRASKIDARE